MGADCENVNCKVWKLAGHSDATLRPDSHQILDKAQCYEIADCLFWWFMYDHVYNYSLISNWFNYITLYLCVGTAACTYTQTCSIPGLSGHSPCHRETLLPVHQT